MAILYYMKLKKSTPHRIYSGAWLKNDAKIKNDELFFYFIVVFNKFMFLEKFQNYQTAFFAQFGFCIVSEASGYWPSFNSFFAQIAFCNLHKIILLN